MPIEISAGCVLIDRSGAEPRALLIRVRAHGYELPKGHVEEGETLEEAAVRELREETGLESAVELTGETGSIEYMFPTHRGWIQKRVVFFAAVTAGPISFGPRPESTHELRWMTLKELADVQLVSENLRPIIRRVLVSDPLAIVLESTSHESSASND